MSTSQPDIRVGHGLARFEGDSFQAGMGAAREAMADIGDGPISAVLVFSSVRHELPALLAGIRSITGQAPLLGVSTAGEICNGVHQSSAVVVVLASPHLQVHMGVGQHISTGWRQGVEEALRASAVRPFFDSGDNSVWDEMAARGNSAFAIIFSPGNTRVTATCGYEIVQELRRRSSGRMPFFGGCAADDWTLHGNSVFCGEQVYPDGLLVAVFETGLQFGIATAHGFQPGQRSVEVTGSRDHEVQQLDGRRAADVYAELVGTSRESLDGKHLTLTTGRPMGVRDLCGQPLINVASFFTPGDGICFARPVPEGTRLTLMETATDEMIAAGEKALLKAMLRSGTARPALALVCSCALRSRMLKERAPEEIAGMLRAVPQLPVLGFYGYGEVGVTEDGTSDHNHGILSVLVLGNELSCSAQIASKYGQMRKTLQECTAEHGQLHTVLRESNQHFMALFEGARDAIFVCDQQSGTILDANAAAEKLTQRAKYELVGLPFGRVLGFEDAEARSGSFQTFSGGTVVPLEAVIIDAEQQNISVEVNANLVEFSNGKRVLQAIVRDITQRRRAEAELRRLNRALSTLSRCNEALVHASDEVQLLNQICEIVVRIGGYRFAWVGYAENDDEKSVRAMASSGVDDGYLEKIQVTWDDTVRGAGPVGTAIKSGEAFVVRDILCHAPFAPWREEAVRRGYASVISLPLQDEERSFGALTIYAPEPDAFDDREVDLLRELASDLAYGITALRSETKRRQAVLALSESEERYRMLFARNPHPMWVFDMDSLAFLEVNDAAVAHYGYSREEFLAMTVKNIRPPEDVPEYLAMLSDEKRGYSFKGGARHRKKDGTIIYVDIAAYRFMQHGKFVSLILANDVTEVRKLQEQLLQSQKLEAVGKLSGGIAHDFNNILMIISSYGEMLLDEVDALSPLRRPLEQIRAATDRAASLTRQLLAFSRKQFMTPVVLNLASTLADLKEMLKRLLGEDISLEVSSADGLWLVKADAGQIEQVVLNLAVNARDAMPKGGKLRVQCANAELGDDFVRTCPGARTGQYVALTVSDSGSGISPDTQVHIFEPFFTTKEPGKGSGLGLSTVYGIVKQSGGCIAVKSEPGKGSAFCIYLPRTMEPQAAKREEKLEIESIPHATVLLVEDEDPTRRAIADYLEQNGFRVVAASSAQEALRRCEAMDAAQIDLLLTDVVMPGMSGTVLAAKFRELHPTAKIVFMSGYTDDVLVRSGVLQSEVAFLAKPFRLPELLSRIRGILANPS